MFTDAFFRTSSLFVNSASLFSLGVDSGPRDKAKRARIISIIEYLPSLIADFICLRVRQCVFHDSSVTKTDLHRQGCASPEYE